MTAPEPIDVDAIRDLAALAVAIRGYWEKYGDEEDA